MKSKPTMPTQQQFVLPLLDCLENVGGSARTGDLYDAVALKMGVSDEVRSETFVSGDCTYNRFEHTVRWAQQKAKALGLVAPTGRALWELTGRGKESLHRAAPGLVITIFETSKGIALFGRAEEAVAHIDDRSVRLIFTSPPYPLLREKEYGNKAANEYVDWLLRIAEMWPKKLTLDGSVVINLGDVMNRGEPSFSTYQERLIIRLEDELGWKLCQRYAWHNPAKMPAPAEWVTVRRVRVKTSIEPVYWFAPNGMPYGDNRQVLAPYSDSMRATLAAGGQSGANRPSGHQMVEGAFAADNGGAIPGNLLTLSNTSSNDGYQRHCRDNGFKVHPARFPGGLPEHFIKMTTVKGDTVWDPFSGSFKTGEMAEGLDRHWIGNELMLDYFPGAVGRFPNAIVHQAALLERLGQPEPMLV